MEKRKTGAGEGEELLVPAQEEFIIDIDQKHKVITVDQMCIRDRYPPL